MTKGSRAAKGVMNFISGREKHGRTKDSKQSEGSPISSQRKLEKVIRPVYALKLLVSSSQTLVMRPQCLRQRKIQSFSKFSSSDDGIAHHLWASSSTKGSLCPPVHRFTFSSSLTITQFIFSTTYSLLSFTFHFSIITILPNNHRPFQTPPQSSK